MSQSDTDRHADHAADHHAAAAVVAHHTQLADTLAAHTAALRVAAVGGDQALAWRRRDALVAWLHAELLPHAHAEEAALYPSAGRSPPSSPT